MLNTYRPGQLSAPVFNNIVIITMMQCTAVALTQHVIRKVTSNLNVPVVSSYKYNTNSVCITEKKRLYVLKHCVLFNLFELPIPFTIK